MSKANCRIFVSMFGPLNELHQRCKDAVDSGFFHGEQTSQESDECFKKTGRTPGSYLVRLRKGAKHQIALAFVDDSHNTKHMLISITKGGFTLHAGGASYPVINYHYHIYSFNLCLYFNDININYYIQLFNSTYLG